MDLNVNFDKPKVGRYLQELCVRGVVSLLKSYMIDNSAQFSEEVI